MHDAFSLSNANRLCGLQVLTSRVLYRYYVREAQVMNALTKGIAPGRPSESLVTTHQWAFVQQCWSPTDAIESRPSSEEIVEFTKTRIRTEGEKRRSTHTKSPFVWMPLVLFIPVHRYSHHYRRGSPLNSLNTASLVFYVHLARGRAREVSVPLLIASWYVDHHFGSGTTFCVKDAGIGYHNPSFG